MIISSSKSHSFVSSLPILIPLISFSCFIVIGRISSTISNNSGDNGHLYFTHDLIGNASRLSSL